MLPNITIIGNTTGAPELRFTGSGKAVANLTVVANKRKKNDAGEWEDAGRSPFIRVAVWGPDAEALVEQIGEERSTKVIVTGQLLAREFEDREGQKRESIELDFATVGVVPSVRDRVTGGRTPSAAPRRADDPWGAPAADDAPPF